jgi:hypothetical protein
MDMSALKSIERLAVQLQARRQAGTSILHDFSAAGLQRLVRPRRTLTPA